MKPTSHDIVEILKAVRDLGYRQFRLEEEGFLLEVSTEQNKGHLAPQEARSALPPPPVAVFGPKPGPSPDTPSPTSVLKTVEAPAPVRAGWIAVLAPMTGTFYRASTPGAAPFVEVGSKVRQRDVICIVEVMKLFNSVRAESNGTIVEISAQNEATVSAGQPIMWIKPD